MGFTVATLGFITTVVGAVGANVVAFRSLPSLSNRSAVRANPAPMFESVFWLLVWAAIGMTGIAILLGGLVVMGGLVGWAPLAPVAIVLVIIPMAWYTRWRIRQLRNSAPEPPLGR